MVASQYALIYAMLFSLAAGFLLGAVYDIFRIRRISAAPNDQLRKLHREPVFHIPDKLKRVLSQNRYVIDCVIIFIEDIIFSLIAAVVMSIVYYRFCNGNIRGIMLFAAGTGFAIYYLTIGRLIKFCAVKIILVIRTVLNFIIKITLIPILKLAEKVYSFIRSRIIITKIRSYTLRRGKAMLDAAEKSFAKATENQRDSISSKESIAELNQNASLKSLQ